MQMLSILIDEFNCNHQSDTANSDDIAIEIYERNKEIRSITEYIADNVKRHKSGMMYLCGHPGTGKTSTLNKVLHELKLNVFPSPVHKI